MELAAQADIAGALLIIGGVVLLGLGLVDAVITTTAISEFPGPLTRVLSQTLWRGFRRLTTRSDSALLRAAGSLVVLSVVSSWVVAIWLGWTLVFAGAPGSVVHAGTGEPASFAATLYFVATSVATTGFGDFEPAGDGWRVLTGVVSLSGLGLITLAVTYLVPVIQAGVDRLRFAQRLHSLGATPHGILASSWEAEHFDTLVSVAPELTADVVELHAKHLAFPVLHFMHGGRTESALAPRLAALDEALTILECGVAPSCRPPPSRTAPLRTAIGTLLDTVVTQAFAVPRREVPPHPRLDDLRARGIPTVSDAEFAAALEKLAERRQKLFSYVTDDSWTWESVHGEGPQ